MIASLPMYDRPETAAANDRLWQRVRGHLGFGPAELARDGDVWAHWLSPDLVLSQTCGYPYRARLHGKVHLAGTPVYDLPGCPPGHYRSVLVARADDPRATPQDFAAARFAYNDALSQSGWAAPQNFARSLGFAFSNPVRSGGHALSARAVAENRADIAALDPLSWALMQRYDDFAPLLREVAQTPPTPVLPYITALSRNADDIFAALEQAVAGLTADDRATLALQGVMRLPAQCYLDVPSPPGP